MSKYTPLSGIPERWQGSRRKEERHHARERASVRDKRRGEERTRLERTVRHKRLDSQRKASERGRPTHSAHSTTGHDIQKDSDEKKTGRPKGQVHEVQVQKLSGSRTHQRPSLLRVHVPRRTSKTVSGKELHGDGTRADAAGKGEAVCHA